MTDNANKPGDQSSERFRQSTDKTGEILSKASPEVNASNLRAAQKANPNKTDTVSPDGKSRFQLTDDSAAKTSSQEQIYKQAGFGDPNEPIGKAKSETAVVEKAGETKAKPELSQNLQAKENTHSTSQPAIDNDRIEIAQAMPPGIKRQELVNALKTGAGELHGILNFAVNTASGVGDALRMLDSADRKINPIKSMLPDTDSEGTKKLHETCASVSMGTRVLIQFSSTLNENSPLYGKDFDPEARQVAQNLAHHLPGQLRKELNDFRKAPIEQRAEKGTEFLLDLYTLADTGVLAASKAGQLAKDSKILSHIGNEMKSLAGKVRDLHEDKLNELVNFMSADDPQFAYDGPAGKGGRQERFGKEEKASSDLVKEKVDRPKPIDLEKLAEHPVVRGVMDRAAKTG